MNQQQTVLLQLSTNDANTILQALLEAPARVSMGVISRIQQQLQRQVPVSVTGDVGAAPEEGEAGSQPPPTPAEIVDRRERAARIEDVAVPPNRAARRRATKK